MSVLAREPRSIRFDRYLLDGALLRWRLSPIRITAVYLLFGFAALYYSDVVLVRQFSEPLLGQLQAVKGGLEVVLTGGLIYALTSTNQAQSERTHEELDRQREELLVLHRVLRHNLRNDLNVVLGTAEAIVDEATTDERRRHGSVIRKTAGKMLQYTEQAARIRRVTATEDRTIEVDLVDALPSLVEELSLEAEGADIDVALPETATVRANHMFLDAIEELVRNSIEHGDGETPTVEVAVDPTAGPLHLVEVSVSDDGPGVPEHVVDILRQSESDQLTHLQGMGLWFVYWVISESDGYLIVDRNADGGALVRVRVPSARVVSRKYAGQVLRPD